MNEEMLKERIWKTKKSRMNMEERIKKENNRTQTIILICSIILVSLSIFSFWENQILSFFKATSYENNLKNIYYFLDNINLIATIVLLCFSLKSNPENQCNRIWMIRHCYTELAKLECSNKNIEELNKEYQEILVKYENHEKKDYDKIKK